jgi:hypothetical protein
MVDEITQRSYSRKLLTTNCTLTTENEDEFEVIQLDLEACPETLSEPNFKDRPTLQRLKKKFLTLLLPNSRWSNPESKEQWQENNAEIAPECNSSEGQCLLQGILQKIVYAMRWMCRWKSLQLEEQELENCIEMASEPNPTVRSPHNTVIEIRNEHA